MTKTMCSSKCSLSSWSHDQPIGFA